MIARQYSTARSMDQPELNLLWPRKRGRGPKQRAWAIQNAYLSFCFLGSVTTTASLEQVLPGGQLSFHSAARQRAGKT